MREVTPIEKYILEKESDTVGGMLVLLLGEQGAGKTVAMTKMVMKDMGIDGVGEEFDPGQTRRIPLWKGQKSCQWILLAANKLPITLWMHESIQDYNFYLTGSKDQGIRKKDIDIESAEDIDVEVKTYETQEELVERLETDRVNVYYIPGAKGNHKEKYFYQKKTYELDKALNNRYYGDHITVNRDEIQNEASTLRKGDFYELQEYMLPGEWEDFRKNKISLREAGHDTTDINYKLWKVKNTGTIYMQGAKVMSKHREIRQDAVNSMSRGEFVVPGFETGEFEIPLMPPDTISWMPETNEVELSMELRADIPDIRPSEKDAQDFLESSPVSRKEIQEIVKVSEAADILGKTNRTIRNMVTKGELDAIQPKDKYLIARKSVEAKKKVPKARQ